MCLLNFVLLHNCPALSIIECNTTHIFVSENLMIPHQTPSSTVMVISKASLSGYKITVSEYAIDHTCREQLGASDAAVNSTQ